MLCTKKFLLHLFCLLPPFIISLSWLLVLFSRTFRFTFKRRSRSQTFELIWWIIINIDTRLRNALERRSIDTDKSEEKECEEWSEEEINHVDYHGLHLHRDRMMQFDSSNFVLYLFCVMLNKQSKRSVLQTGEREEKSSITAFFHNISLTIILSRELFLIGEHFLNPTKMLRL